jgi:hypothetical protein
VRLLADRDAFARAGPGAQPFPQSHQFFFHPSFGERSALALTVKRMSFRFRMKFRPGTTISRSH